MVGDTKPGTKATITVWRKGQTRDLPITIAEMQPDKVAKADAEEDAGAEATRERTRSAWPSATFPPTRRRR